MDCGPTCLRMIAKFYGRSYSIEYLRELSYITREGISMLGISEAAERIGFKAIAAKLNFQQLDNEVQLPCILHWNNSHFVVLPPQNYNSKQEKEKILIADPTHGLVKIDRKTFEKSWLGNGKEGFVVVLHPTEAFYHQEGVEPKKGVEFLFSYLKPYRKFVTQVILSLVISSLLTLTLPFLTQSLVDYGINHQNMGFVYLILISQLVLFAGSISIEVIRSWILLHINSRINIHIISDFLLKLMKLPISYFDSKKIGDIHQRIGDHQRVQNFLTGTTLSTLFSFINLVVFSVVLSLYSGKILLVFLGFSTASVTWIMLFLKKRKNLDYKRFQRLSENENVLFELINGMQEIKLNNSETAKRWQWEKLQVKLFKINIDGLALGQYQQVGAAFFNQLKNILISYVSATEVMSGNMTLGMLLSVTYIIGQMNSPLDQLLGFVQAAQDARISLDRLREIHVREDEEKKRHVSLAHSEDKAGSLYLQDLSFQYAGPASPLVLKNINLTIPQGKVTAIVGTSGSGKTTLLKLLLGFYEPTAGRIFAGDTDLKSISPKYWRRQCGTVMQDSFIFSDTIAKNISISDEHTNQKKLLHAAKVANIQGFIEKLPLKYQTKIGNEGNGVSGGQRQRIQIARAVYKDPGYLFFDEATSSLDANNERIIMENLERFFIGKTVVIIAHRLSTVKHADQIIVLDNGSIAESGTHQELVEQRGKYFELVKNQLELEA